MPAIGVFEEKLIIEGHHRFISYSIMEILEYEIVPQSKANVTETLNWKEVIIDCTDWDEGKEHHLKRYDRIYGEINNLK